MNYCSLDDAWGDNKISNQFQKYMNDKSCSDPVKLDCPSNENKTIEKFTENKNNVNINVINCEDIINHVNQCKYCYNRLHHKFNVPQKNELINNLHNIINNNKDTIVLILIGLFIVMFFKLVSNITSK